jgi:hypothetical protein
MELVQLLILWKKDKKLGLAETQAIKVDLWLKMQVMYMR